MMMACELARLETARLLTKAAFMADSQVPRGLEALGGTITEAAWRVKPS